MTDDDTPTIKQLAAHLGVTEYEADAAVKLLAHHGPIAAKAGRQVREVMLFMLQSGLDQDEIMSCVENVFALAKEGISIGEAVRKVTDEFYSGEE